MADLLKKKGVLVFFAATGLLFAGQMYLSSHAPKELRSADRIMEFDAQNIHALRIEKESGIPSRGLRLEIGEAGTHASAKFDSGAYALRSHVEGDVLVLTFSAPKNEGKPVSEPFSEKDQILVPASIRSLEFSNANFLKITKKTPTELAALDVRFVDCPTNANFENMTVDKMTVTKHCQVSGAPSASHTSGYIHLSDMKINSLEITSASGSVDFAESVKVDTLQLNLGADVLLSGSVALLRNAHLVSVP